MTTAIKTFPWGGEIYMEIPLNKKSSNKFYARHGKTGEGREYLEFSKFGPIPNSEEGVTYIQKLRLFSVKQWSQLKFFVENELAHSIGWDVLASDKAFKKEQKELKLAAEEAAKEAEIAASVLTV